MFGCLLVSVAIGFPGIGLLEASIASIGPEKCAFPWQGLYKGNHGY
jgi:hypothetical protein